MLTLLGVSIPFLSRAHVLAKIKEAKTPLFIITLNPEILLLAHKDKEYRDIINSADIKVVDGVGIVLMARLLYGVNLKRFPGADLAETLLSMNYKKIFILGGSKEANEKALRRIKKKEARIKGLGGNFTFQEAVNEINAFATDILFVAFGAPKQEQFIYNFINNSQTRKLANSQISIGIGGTVDYWANPSLRATKIVRRIGLEWLWRLILQPWRFSRMFRAVIVFPLTCLWEWFLVK